MEFLINYWQVIFGCCILVAACIFGVYKFIKLPHEQRMANLKEWLKLAVIEAEASFTEGGAGILKLRSVYDAAIERFPWVSTAISFQAFSNYVDEALDWMESALTTNKTIAKVIEEAKKEE